MEGAPQRVAMRGGRELEGRQLRAFGPGLEARDAEALARTVQLRVLQWFARRWLPEPSAAADMRTWRR